jgi:hypothetical protein
MNAAIARMAAAALAAATVVLLAVAALPQPADLTSGGVLSADDRRALAAAPALRGADPAPADPTVDLTDPTAVARAYLVAAHSLVPGDAGHTQRRAAGYARPGSPAAVGVVVLDPPPPGAYRTAVVTDIDAVGAYGDRRGFRAALHRDRTARRTGHGRTRARRRRPGRRRRRPMARRHGDLRRRPRPPRRGGMMRQEQSHER